MCGALLCYVVVLLFGCVVVVLCVVLCCCVVWCDVVWCDLMWCVVLYVMWCVLCDDVLIWCSDAECDWMWCDALSKCVSIIWSDDAGQMWYHRDFTVEMICGGKGVGRYVFMVDAFRRGRVLQLFCCIVTHVFVAKSLRSLRASTIVKVTAWTNKRTTPQNKNKPL